MSALENALTGKKGNFALLAKSPVARLNKVAK